MNTVSPTIGVTGATGLLGWHVRCHLSANGMTNVKMANRETFANKAELVQFASECDTIIHLAGKNRGDDSEVEATNINLAKALVDSLRQQEKAIDIVFANSTHQELDTPYGRSKRSAADLFDSWARESGSNFSNIVFPNVFGEGGRPYANSVVSTFCYQLSRSETPKVIADGKVELLHAGDAAKLILQCMNNRSNETIRPCGVEMTVSQLLAKLQKLRSSYKSSWIPDVGVGLDRSLFNTLRFAIFEVAPTIPLKRHADSRGAFVEIVKRKNGGQTSFSTTVPGVTRGNHFHFRKIERFVILSGRGTISLRKIFSNEIINLELSGDDSIAVDMPTMYSHSITNTGDEPLITMFWIDEIYDETDPDTFAELVTP
jgi:UDP-2-acetamido-2,6-beta-L-arabino-hexul-4-ose reductase